VEPRFVLPWIGVLAATGGALVANGLHSRRVPPALGLVLGLVGVGILLVRAAGWALPVTSQLGLPSVSPAQLAVYLPDVPSRALFLAMVLIDIGAILGLTLLAVWLVADPAWRWYVPGALGLLIAVFFLRGQFTGPWREWNTSLDQGVIARQTLHLPPDLVVRPDRLYWLLFDLVPNSSQDGLEVRINGDLVKPAQGSLVPWIHENSELGRHWWGLLLDPAWLQPGTDLVVDARVASAAGAWLYGDFPADDPDVYFGPAIDYVGRYRSPWRQTYHSSRDARVARAFELDDIGYDSALVLVNQQPSTTDLSTAAGRQYGQFRILLGAVDIGDSPLPADPQVLSALQRELVVPPNDVLLHERVTNGSWAQVIEREDGEQLRFLGHRVQWNAEQGAAQMELYFEVLAPLRRAYLVWLKAAPPNGTDYVGAAPAESVANDIAVPARAHAAPAWQPGRVYRLVYTLRTNPGAYFLTFGGHDTPQHSYLVHKAGGTDTYPVSLGWYLFDVAPTAAERPAPLPPQVSGLRALRPAS
jgi:hypothetical protein